MKRKVKFLTIIILLLSLILLLLIRLNYPMKVSTTESILHIIPIYYWILLITIPTLICTTFILTESKSTCVLLAVIYFFVLYSFYLLFVIPPAGTDMSEGGHIFSLLKEGSTLSIEQLRYFQWPIHYVFYMSSIKIVGAGLSFLTILLFSFILMMPLFFTLSVSEHYNKKIFFLLPVGYIILSYYLINLQWVPQFTGLMFLILTIGCHAKYKKSPSKKFYFLTVFFYIICVLTHPFIFVFFPAALFLDRYIFPLLPKKIFRSGNENNKDISLLLLVSVFFIGLIFRFESLLIYIRNLIFPGDGERRSWELINRLLRESRISDEIAYETSPLYHLVSREIYLISRYTTLLFLLIILLLLSYILLKNIRKIDSFDVSLGISGASFFFLGLILPRILGQRAFQVIFLKFPRYFSNLFEYKQKILVFVLIIAITIAPLLFTTNRTITFDLSGGRHIQDENTLSSGRFVVNNVDSKPSVLVAELSFFPGRGDNIYHTRRIAEERISLSKIDMIIDSSKQRNSMDYYGLEIDFRGTSQIYDNGDSQVLIYEDI